MDRMIEFASNHWILFSALGLIVFLLIQDFYEALTRKYKNTTPLGVVKLMNSTDITVVDVREPAEFIKAHIEDSLNIPSTKFDNRIDELGKYKNSPILISCQSGTRSPQACSKLIKEGFADVHLLKGGMQAWEDHNLPIRRSKPKHRK